MAAVIVLVAFHYAALWTAPVWLWIAVIFLAVLGD